jgi:hypothetical protein
VIDGLLETRDDGDDFLGFKEGEEGDVEDEILMDAEVEVSLEGDGEFIEDTIRLEELLSLVGVVKVGHDLRLEGAWQMILIHFVLYIILRSLILTLLLT